jgi:hypothetical protein
MASGGWTKKLRQTVGTNVVQELWYKWADHGLQTWTVQGFNSGTNGCGCCVTVLRNVDPFFPFDVEPVIVTGNSTNPNPGSITPVSNNCAIIIAANSSASDSSTTQPANYTNQMMVPTSGATISMGMASRTLNPPAAEDPANWTTWSTGNWSALTIAIRPASSMLLT